MLQWRGGFEIPGNALLPSPLLTKHIVGILPAVDLISDKVLVGIFYFVGFGLFCLEALISVWVIQQVYMYFRGSGKAAEMQREAAQVAMRAAI
ncbi:hypothetical protein ZIOFF_025671 [Zingiber officinale]|uniref:Secretory carrier-associated membrane protein n=1 Tax=Zingiber officinale TaxID=94328 RepID=A0A8J5H3Z4_ZINOF|nr:hypothetical protein ZIOFF_025671 [Zingiber officinale]